MPKATISGPHFGFFLGTEIENPDFDRCCFQASFVIKHGLTNLANLCPRSVWSSFCYLVVAGWLAGWAGGMVIKDFHKVDRRKSRRIIEITPGCALDSSFLFFWGRGIWTEIFGTKRLGRGIFAAGMKAEAFARRHMGEGIADIGGDISDFGKVQGRLWQKPWGIWFF